MTAYRVTVIRNDGLTHSTDVSGWSAEPTMLNLRKQALNDTRTVTVVVFEQDKETWSVLWHEVPVEPVHQTRGF